MELVYNNNDVSWMIDIEPSEFDEWLYKKDPELVNTVGLFLKDYENLTPLVIGERTFYVDSQNKPIFYYYQDEKNGVCWFKYQDFWGVFRDHYGIGYSEIQGVLKVWLELTYNLMELTPCRTETIST